MKVNEKDSERDQRDMGGGGMGDDFRVTMAMNLGAVNANIHNQSIQMLQEEDIVRKPKIKKKKRPIKGLFQRLEEIQLEGEDTINLDKEKK